MRRSITALLAVLALVLTLGGSASADSVTVQGTGDIEKMTANNGDKAVVVKLYGPGGKDEVRWVNASLKGTDGVKYTAQAGWYGADWEKSLSRGSTLVSCGKLAITYNSTGGFWKLFVPRGCLDKLTNRIKVKGELVSVASATPGETSWTSWIKKG
jgi:hypothetical protein